MTFTFVLFLAYSLLDLILWEAISFKSGTNAAIDDQNQDRYRIELFDRSLRMKIFMVEIID